VYRADLPRTLTLVVALLLTVAPTRSFAREFRVADTQNEDYPTVQALGHMGHLVEGRSGGRLLIRLFHSRQLGEKKETIGQACAGAIDLNRTNVALIGNIVPAVGERSRARAEAAGVTIVKDFDRPFEEAMLPLCEQVRRDPAFAQLIDPIGKVE